MRYDIKSGIHYDEKEVVVVCKCLTYDNVNIASKVDIVDTVAIHKGDIIALGGQTNTAENGIYVHAGTSLIKHPLFRTEEVALPHIAVVAGGTYKNYRLYLQFVGTEVIIGLGEMLGGTTGDIILITREEFFTLKNATSLKAGSWYLITDFAQTYNFVNMPSTVVERAIPTIEPMLVFATSGNSVDSEIKSLTYPQDAITWNPDYYNENDYSYWCPANSYLHYSLSYTGGAPDAGDIVFEFGGNIITILFSDIPGNLLNLLIAGTGIADITIDINNPNDFVINFPTYAGTSRLALVNSTLTSGGITTPITYLQTGNYLTVGYPSDYQGVIVHRHDKVLNNQTPYDFRNITFRHWPVTATAYTGVAEVKATGVFTLNDPLVYPTDGDTITIDTEVYEFDSNGAVTPGNIAMPFIDTYIPKEDLITFNTVPDAGTWGFENIAAPYSLAFNADAATVQTYIRTLSSRYVDFTVTGDYIVGFTIKHLNFPVSLLNTLEVYHNLTTLGSAVVVTVTPVVSIPLFPFNSNDYVEAIRSTVETNSALVVPSVTGTDITLTAVPIGSTGNAIATTTTTAFGSFATATLEGGVDEVLPAAEAMDIVLDPLDSNIYMCMRSVDSSTFPSLAPTIWTIMCTNFEPISVSTVPYWFGLTTNAAVYIDLPTFGTVCTDNIITNETMINYHLTAVGHRIGDSSHDNVISSEGYGIYLQSNCIGNIIKRDCNNTVLLDSNTDNDIYTSTCFLSSANSGNTIYLAPIIMGTGNNSNIFENVNGYCSSSNEFNIVRIGNMMLGLANSHNTLVNSSNLELLASNNYSRFVSCNSIDLTSCNYMNLTLAEAYSFASCNRWEIKGTSTGTRMEDYTIANSDNIIVNANCILQNIDFSGAVFMFDGNPKEIYYDVTMIAPRFRYMDNAVWVSTDVND